MGLLAGAPGVGKTTISKLLRIRLDCPCVELDWIRSAHLHDGWRGASPSEEALSYEILAFTVKKYLEFGFGCVLINCVDLERMRALFVDMPEGGLLGFVLVTGNSEELKRRVLSPTRDSGWRDFEESIRINDALQRRELMDGEQRIDTSNRSPEAVVESIATLLGF